MGVQKRKKRFISRTPSSPIPSEIDDKIGASSYIVPIPCQHLFDAFFIIIIKTRNPHKEGTVVEYAGHYIIVPTVRVRRDISVCYGPIVNIVIRLPRKTMIRMVYFQYLPIQSERCKTFFLENRVASFRSANECRVIERSKIEKTLVLRQKHSIEGIRIGCGPQYGDLFPEIRHPKSFQVLRIAVLPQQGIPVDTMNGNRHRLALRSRRTAEPAHP